jgi:hypothetical protein
MYLLNQLSNVIMVFDISTDSRGAAPKLVQTISTRGAGLPPSAPTIDINAAEVVVTPDGTLHSIFVAYIRLIVLNDSPLLDCFQQERYLAL